jgi:hypothetical protein
MPLQLRRGSNTSRQATTFAAGEPVWTTDTNKLFIGDGVTPGGIAVDTTGSFSYTLTTATSSAVGGVKIGSGITITADGTISAATGDSNTFSNITVTNTATIGILNAPSTSTTHHIGALNVSQSGPYTYLSSDTGYIRVNENTQLALDGTFVLNGILYVETISANTPGNLVTVAGTLKANQTATFASTVIFNTATNYIQSYNSGGLWSTNLQAAHGIGLNPGSGIVSITGANGIEVDRIQNNDAGFITIADRVKMVGNAIDFSTQTSIGQVFDNPATLQMEAAGRINITSPGGLKLDTNSTAGLAGSKLGVNYIEPVNTTTVNISNTLQVATLKFGDGTTMTTASTGSGAASTGDIGFSGNWIRNTGTGAILVSPQDGVTGVYLPSDTDADTAAVQLFNTDTTGTVTITAGSTPKTWTFSHDGSITKPNGIKEITTATTGVSTTATFAVASYDTSEYACGKFSVQVKNYGAFHFAEIVVGTNTVDQWITQYGVTTSEGEIGTFSVDRASTVVTLYFTPTVGSVSLTLRAQGTLFV